MNNNQHGTRGGERMMMMMHYGPTGITEQTERRFLGFELAGWLASVIYGERDIPQHAYPDRGRMRYDALRYIDSTVLSIILQIYANYSSGPLLFPFFPSLLFLFLFPFYCSFFFFLTLFLAI